MSVQPVASTSKSPSGIRPLVAAWLGWTFDGLDGYLYIMGRTDDIINVAGHRLSTGGMEEVLASHPDVAECAVIGVPHAQWGEAVHAACALKPGAAVDEAGLIAFVGERLARYKRPRSVVLVPAPIDRSKPPA